MKPQPASRSSFHFQMKCLAPCSRLTPGDLDDTCRTLKPSFRRIFPASARLLLDHVWTPCDLRIKWLPFQPTTENVNVIIVLSRSNSAHLHPARPASQTFKQRKVPSLPPKAPHTAGFGARADLRLRVRSECHPLLRSAGAAAKDGDPRHGAELPV